MSHSTSSFWTICSPLYIKLICGYTLSIFIKINFWLLCLTPAWNVIGYRRVLITSCYDESTVLSWEGLDSTSVKISMISEWQKEHWKLFYGTLSRKPCINTESTIRISPFSYTIIFVKNKMKFLSVAIPPTIYHGWSTPKMFW